MNNNKLWFKARKYGWGWTPITWEGWVFILVALSYGLWLGVEFEKGGEVNIEMFLLKVGLIIATIVVVGFLKGEKPRWRWGD